MDGSPPHVDSEVIIPRGFSNLKIERNYFNPRFVHLVRGKAKFVEWVNQDIVVHRLVFYEITKASKIKYLFDTNKIAPGKSSIIKFNFKTSSRIDYYCKLHKNESGTVIIYPREEEIMSNTDQLRFLSKMFGIKPPDTLSHLRSE